MNNKIFLKKVNTFIKKNKTESDVTRSLLTIESAVNGLDPLTPMKSSIKDLRRFFINKKSFDEYHIGSIVFCLEAVLEPIFELTNKMKECPDKVGIIDSLKLVITEINVLKYILTQCMTKEILVELSVKIKLATHITDLKFDNTSQNIEAA